MTVALLSIGTELARGEIENKNAVHLAAELTEAGFTVAAIEVVPDDLPSIIRALGRLGEEHAFVVATGGLGPTTDDLTALAAARAAGVELQCDDGSLLAIKRRVEARGKVLNAGHEKQALVPAGSDVLPNVEGTAPGFGLRIGRGTAYFLPGVPREMQRMFADQVLPRMRPAARSDTHQIRLGTYGLPESIVGEKLVGVERAFPGVTLGYRVRFPTVDVKVHAKGGTHAQARELALRATAEVKIRLGDVVYGEGADEFPERVGRAVHDRGWRLAAAESCTGGLITHLLTAYPASDYFIGSVVSYANSAKTKLLAVSEDTLRGHGAVSVEVAAEMASGARRVCDVDVAVAVTGIAGPSGGSDEKPVGLVHWAVAHPGGVCVKHRVFPGDRGEIQLASAYAALDTVRRLALGLGPRDPG